MLDLRPKRLMRFNQLAEGERVIGHGFALFARNARSRIKLQPAYGLRLSLFSPWAFLLARSMPKDGHVVDHSELVSKSRWRLLKSYKTLARSAKLLEAYESARVLLMAAMLAMPRRDPQD